MNIKLWYSKSMGQWRWSLTDEFMDMASGQQPDLHDAMNDIANTVEHMLESSKNRMVSI